MGAYESWEEQARAQHEIIRELEAKLAEAERGRATAEEDAIYDLERLAEVEKERDHEASLRRAAEAAAELAREQTREQVSRAAAAEARLAEVDRDRLERQRKRGAYWLTPEGRIEIRETWDDPEDGTIPLPLLNALEAAEADVRALREWLAEFGICQGCGWALSLPGHGCERCLDARAALAGVKS